MTIKQTTIKNNCVDGFKNILLNHGNQLQNLVPHVKYSYNNKEGTIQQLTLSLLPLRLVFRLFRVVGGGFGGGPRGSLGSPDLSRCFLKLLFAGSGDRLLGRFRGTENDLDLRKKKKAIRGKTKNKTM
jgi:hypothetical protein